MEENDMDKREILLEVENLRIEFGSKKKPFVAVDDVSFQIYKGETFGLVGESGSGKTTIGRSIVRINKAKSGSIKFKSKVISGKIDKKTDREITEKIHF